MSDEQTMAPREILARTAEQWLGPGDVKQVLPLADAQLAALEAAGYVVVTADRFERLQDECRTLIYRDYVLDSDLEPLPEQEGQDKGVRAAE